MESIRSVNPRTSGGTHRLVSELSGSNWHLVYFLLERTGLEHILYARCVLKIRVGLLKGRDGMVGPQRRAHLGENWRALAGHNEHRSAGRTGHCCVDAANIG